MIPLDGLLNKSSRFGQNFKFLFFTFFFHSAFHLVFVVATTNLSFYCSHFVGWNLTCWCILTTSKLIRFWSSSVDFPHFGIILTSETGQTCNFRIFSGERKGGMACTLACWCILTTLWTYYILAMVCWFSEFWQNCDFVKQVKFRVSGDFLQNAWEEWLEIWHADVSWLHFQLLIFWAWSVDFPHFEGILTQWNKSNLQFWGIFLWMQWSNWLN